MADIEVVSGVSDEAYPEIFDIRAMLPQSDVKKPGQLTDDQLKRYFEEVRFYFVFIYFLYLSLLPQNALKRDCNGKCIE